MAIAELLAAGVPQYVNILTYEAIEATETPGKTIKEVLLPFLSELKYSGPLVAAGLIALTSRLTAALAAGLVAASVGGTAVERSSPNHRHASFERALDAGSLVLWVVVETPDREAAARFVFDCHGVKNVYIHAHKIKGIGSGISV